MKQFFAAIVTVILASTLYADPVKVVVRPLPTTRGVPAENHRIPDEVLSRFEASKLAEYGSFTVVELPMARVDALREEAKLRGEETEVHPEWDELVLPRRTIDTRREAPTNDGATPSLFVVQFVGPEMSSWYDELQTSDVKLVNYLSYNGALIWTSPSTAKRLRKQPNIQFVRRYDPSLKGKPADLGSTAEPSSTTVQFVNSDEADAIIATLTKTHAVSNDVVYANYRNITCDLRDDEAAALLDEPSVVLIEHRGISIISGEREAIGQTSIEGYSSTPPGFVTTSRLPFQYLWYPLTGRTLVRPRKSSATAVPNPPDYRAWLASGLDTSAYKIAVYDTGLSSGRTLPPHPDICSNWNASTQTCTSRSISWQLPPGSTDNGADTYGHGTMVAVMAIGDPIGATDATLTPMDDLNQRFYFGLGVAPKTGLIVQKALVGEAWGGSAYYWLNGAKTGGASVMTMSRNELCCPGLPAGVYSTLDQEFDDAVQRVNIPVTAAAGNIYPAGWTCPQGWPAAACTAARAKAVLPPALAKNVITAGATEGFRGTSEPVPTCRDTATIPNEWRNARSFNDVAFFSRRGAVSTDLRIKPELVAPSSLITSGKSSERTGTLVYCTENGQLQRYETASGTSFSSPQVAAAAILLNKWNWRSPTNPMTAPMVKAALTGSALSLWNGGKDWFTNPTSGAAVGARPDRVTGQGWGRLNLNSIFQTVPGQVFYDNMVMTTTGTVYSLNFEKQLTAGRTIIVLAWNDPVTLAQTTTAALQTDLNLEVVAGGVSYRGNGLSGETSYGWTAYDTVNNLEMVVLPYNPSVTSFTVNVRGARVQGATNYALYLMNAH